MSLSKRIVVRVSDDLESWIGQQAEQEGLDSATWVRSTLTKIMRGKSIQEAPQYVQDQQPTEPSEIDIDELVNEGLAASVGQLETEAAQSEAQSNGVRAIVRRPPPYSLSTQPKWIDK